MFSKKSGKKAVLMLAAVAAMTTAGCARKAEETVKPEMVQAASVPVSIAAESSTAETEAAAVETQATAKASVQDTLVGILTGTVTDAGTSTVTITADRYPEGITFSREDAATEFANGLTIGQEITIFYKGEISNGDAGGVQTELIRDKREHDGEAQAAMITGKVTAIGMSVVTVETEDGGTVSFEQDPKPVNTTSGPLEGDRITIVYSYQDEGSEGAIVPELLKNAE